MGTRSVPHILPRQPSSRSRRVSQSVVRESPSSPLQRHVRAATLVSIPPAICGKQITNPDPTKPDGHRDGCRTRGTRWMYRRGTHSKGYKNVQASLPKSWSPSLRLMKLLHFDSPSCSASLLHRFHIIGHLRWLSHAAPLLHPANRPAGGNAFVCVQV